MEINNYDIERWRDYVSLFSGQTCEAVLRSRSVSAISNVFRKYDLSLGEGITAWKYLAYAYNLLEQNYRNEYVFKNTFINSLLIGHYALDTTVAFSEFRVGDAIADLVLMNGISKAFEIKSELDSKVRLLGQLAEYEKLFDECYIVIPYDQYHLYREIVSSKVGIILLMQQDRKLIMIQRRKAKRNNFIDVDVLMRSIRTDEYKAMVKEIYGKLPDVSPFEMYDACRHKLNNVSSKKLHSLFLSIIKKRRNLTEKLPSYPREVRQLFLSRNFNISQTEELNNLYNNILDT